MPSQLLARAGRGVEAAVLEPGQHLDAADEAPLASFGASELAGADAAPVGHRRGRSAASALVLICELPQFAELVMAVARRAASAQGPVCAAGVVA